MRDHEPGMGLCSRIRDARDAMLRKCSMVLNPVERGCTSKASSKSWDPDKGMET
jgi:hypothetical protein